MNTINQHQVQHQLMKQRQQEQQMEMYQYLMKEQLTSGIEQYQRTVLRVLGVVLK